MLLSHLALELLVPALLFSFLPRTSPFCTALVCPFLQLLLLYLFHWLHLLDFLSALQPWMYPQGKFPLVSPLHVHQLSVQTLSRTCLQEASKVGALTGIITWLPTQVQAQCPQLRPPSPLALLILPR